MRFGCNNFSVVSCCDPDDAFKNDQQQFVMRAGQGKISLAAADQISFVSLVSKWQFLQLFHSL